MSRNKRPPATTARAVSPSSNSPASFLVPAENALWRDDAFSRSPREFGCSNDALPARESSAIPACHSSSGTARCAYLEIVHCLSQIPHQSGEKQNHLHQVGRQKNFPVTSNVPYHHHAQPTWDSRSSTTLWDR